MRAKGVALQGALAAAGLVAALSVWQREPESAPGEVVVVDASKRSLERVRYEDDLRWSELVPQGDEVWVRVATKPPPAALSPGGGVDAGRAALGQDGGVPAAGLASAPEGGVDGGTVAAAPSPPPLPPPPPPRLLRANETGEQLFGRFAPMRATRNLGVLEDKKLAELGLKDSPRKLTLTVSGTPESFTVSRTQSGIGSTYLRRERDGRVFVVGPSLVSDLESAASRLVDRRLHVFKPGEYDAIAVKQGSTQRRYSVAGQPPTLTPEDAPGKPDEFARNWHEKVWRLVPMEMLGKGEEPPGAAPQPAFQLSYFKDGKQLGELNVFKGEKNAFYARSEHTAGWARLHGTVEPLAVEAGKVAGAK